MREFFNVIMDPVEHSVLSPVWSTKKGKCPAPETAV
jgi:hypothetical protein